MISGLWMPLDTLPEFLQTVGKLCPFYWGHQDLLAIVCLTAFITIISVKAMNYKDKR
ncbi:hypothetical protein SFC23_21545 [Shouchella clausii]|uniref:hypothetical protein n=1 Tax=Shouchella clausii TaxID=79880 RepID=UPI00398306E9